MSYHYHPTVQLLIRVLAAACLCATPPLACSESSPDYTITIGAAQHQRIPVVLGIIGKGSSLKTLGSTLKHDLEFSNQCTVTLMHLKAPKNSKDITEYADQGFPLMIIVKETEDKSCLEWRLYDTSSAAMIIGKSSLKHGTNPVHWAHNLADLVWPSLVGTQGCFSSKLAYCKELKNKNARGTRFKTIKHIYVADYDGSHEQPLVTTPRINVAPRWNNDQDNPLIFFSEFTDYNVQLKACTMQQERWVVSNFEGLNMLPSFSGDGSTIVYCLSHKGASNIYRYEFDPDHHRAVYVRITQNKGTNVSPVLLPNNDIVFCSDFETKLPQIYQYHHDTQQLTRLTKDGFCASPAYCLALDCLAYAKIVHGVTQLYKYSFATGKHEQLTTGPGHKEEPSWSPCGTYIAYAWDSGGTRRIALFNTLTGEHSYVTPRHEICSYPCWSPCYSTIPSIGAS